MRKMFALDEIAEAVGGRIVNETESKNSDIIVSRVNKDSRTIEQGDLYVAIVGERFDGHDFCAQAYNDGANVLLVSDESKLPHPCVAVVVEDTVKALGLLAKHYRFKLNCKVIGVTGSVGKTTTREMIALACSASGKVHATSGNQNNEIGLPMTILTAPEDTEVMVLEMGMRLRGEISYLTNIACPDIGVITNVGYSHIERLGSREEIRLAKLEILEGIVSGGILIISSDDSYLYDYAREVVPMDKVLACISINKCDIQTAPIWMHASNIDMNDGLKFDIEGGVNEAKRSFEGVSLNLNGVHFVNSGMFALLCANICSDNMEAAVNALKTYAPMSGRGQTVRTDKYTVINDAYNAGPESMEGAFLNLSLTSGIEGMEARRVAVLGGMLELGDFADMLHEQIGKTCGKYSFDRIFVTGDNKDAFIAGLTQTSVDADYVVCKDTMDIKLKMSEYIRPGDIILFKASNAFGFEKLAKELINDTDK